MSKIYVVEQQAWQSAVRDVLAIPAEDPEAWRRLVSARFVRTARLYYSDAWKVNPGNPALKKRYRPEGDAMRFEGEVGGVMFQFLTDAAQQQQHRMMQVLRDPQSTADSLDASSLCVYEGRDTLGSYRLDAYVCWHAPQVDAPDRLRDDVVSHLKKLRNPSQWDLAVVTLNDPPAAAAR